MWWVGERVPASRGSGGHAEWELKWMMGRWVTSKREPQPHSMREKFGYPCACLPIIGRRLDGLAKSLRYQYNCSPKGSRNIGVRLPKMPDSFITRSTACTKVKFACECQMSREGRLRAPLLFTELLPPASISPWQFGQGTQSGESHDCQAAKNILYIAPR